MVHPIEKVRGKFMIQRNFYVFRDQFPLILAYAVTIHKCQGLSLDCAIIDLNEHAYTDGIAYVALSRVRSLAGLYLITFPIEGQHSALMSYNIKFNAMITNTWQYMYITFCEVIVCRSMM